MLDLQLLRSSLQTIQKRTCKKDTFGFQLIHLFNLYYKRAVLNYANQKNEKTHQCHKQNELKQKGSKEQKSEAMRN